MNDGAVAYRDLSLRSRNVTYDFLLRSWRLFQAIQADETKHGLPGPRAVLACGFRVRGRRAGLDATRGHFASILKRIERGQLDYDQAVREAAAMRPRFDIVPELQANFAFTKAYVAELSGGKGGLGGSNFYVDLMIFGGQRPNWIGLGPNIDWRDERLNLDATFARVTAVTGAGNAEDPPTEILDGLRIAQLLANDPDVLAALRAAQKP
jgi:hypothetical protein